MHPLQEEYIESKGWTIECESPLEVRHTDGSFATLNAAQLVIDSLRIPDINVTWFHPAKHWQCEEIIRDDERDGMKKGDLWIVNGGWSGHKEGSNGFRIHYTNELVECDNSLWQKKEELGEYFEETSDVWDDFPF